MTLSVSRIDSCSECGREWHPESLAAHGVCCDCHENTNAWNMREDVAPL